MSKRVTTQELHTDVKHLHDCMHRLEDQVKDNRTYFDTRLDKLDNRIFWVLGLTVSTLVAIIGVMIAP